MNLIAFVCDQARVSPGPQDLDEVMSHWPRTHSRQNVKTARQSLAPECKNRKTVPCASFDYEKIFTSIVLACYNYCHVFNIFISFSII